MNKRNRFLSLTASALLPLTAATLPFTDPAWSSTSNVNNANAVNMSALKPAAVDCNNFCGNLINAAAVPQDGADWMHITDQKKLDSYTTGINGGSWATGANSPDDQWCANHGYITNPATPADGTATVSTQTCNVTMLNGDTNCADTNIKIMRCQMHNSQVIPQCLAYQAIDGASKAEGAVLALDIAAAGICGAACAATNMSIGTAAPIVETACQAAGATATVAELVSVFAMSSGPVSSAINGLMAAGAGTATGISLAGGIGVGTTTKGLDDAATHANPMDLPGTESTCTEGVGCTAGEDPTHLTVGSENPEKSHQEASKSKKATSCSAAVVFAMMAGIRGASWSNYKGHLRDNACHDIQSLASNVLSGSTTPTGGTNNPAGTGFSGVVTAGGTVSTPGSGGSSSGNIAGGTGGTTTSNLDPSVPPALSAATDGGMLTQTGLDKLVAKPAAEIAKALSNGTTPAQALQSALGSTGNSGAAGALAGLAQAAQENANSLGGKVNLGSLPSAMYASGGGSRSGGGGEASNPFANLFGQQGAGAGASRATASESFGGSARAMDIYHTGTTQNLFEIVSGKVSQVAGRVGVK
jgi:hypothetical protein